MQARNSGVARCWEWCQQHSCDTHLDTAHRTCFARVCVVRETRSSGGGRCGCCTACHQLSTSASSETRPTEHAKTAPSQPSHVTHSTSTRRARSRLHLCPHSLARFRMYELLTYHPTVHEKMKSGVAAIGWGINPAFPDTRSFFCRLESGEIMSPRRAQSAFETQSCIAQSAFETQSCTAQSAFETQSCTAQSAFETQPP
jgi:hypothetical protein